MGSFPNKVAAQILKSLFIDKTVSATPALYTNTAANTAGVYTSAANGTVNGTPLYIGLISGGLGTTNNGIPNGSTNLSNYLNDATIVSSGTSNWPVIPGSKGLKEFTGSNNETERKQISFTVTSNTDVDGATTVTITGPTSAISFANSGGVSSAQLSHESVIGFFITTLASGAGTGTSNLPTILAYGTLSASRNVQLGDNPTFAANSISITLD